MELRTLNIYMYIFTCIYMVLNIPTKYNLIANRFIWIIDGTNKFYHHSGLESTWELWQFKLRKR